MKRIIFCAISILLIYQFCGAFGSDTARKDLGQIPGWILVWNDEFDTGTIDKKKWNVRNAPGAHNNELEYYSPEAVYIKEGCLIIESRKRDKADRKYVSGLIETNRKFSQTYGRFEIRAKLPKGKGIWPAHWIMNTENVWPPEIDIMELIGSEPNKVIMTNHYGKYPDNRMESNVYTGPDFTKDFHTFALEWEPDEMRWFVDGVKRFSTKKNIPSIPFYIILNTAVGGNMPGDPDAATQFPQLHIIDYVRIYERDTARTKKLTILPADNGRVVSTPDQRIFNINSDIELTAVPDIGYKFSSWSNNVQEKKKNPVIIKMDMDKEVAACFIPDPDVPKLLSKGKKVTASTGQAGALRAELAVDGNLKTRWSSEFSDPQWIYVDLGKTRDIKAVRLNWETAYGRLYEIQISNDGDNWETVKRVEDDIGGQRVIWFEKISARYVRIHGISRGTIFGYSLWEFEVFGKE